MEILTEHVASKLIILKVLSEGRDTYGYNELSGTVL